MYHIIHVHLCGSVALHNTYAHAHTLTLTRTQGRKKKFIDKKESSTFHVVHRSQQDKANEGEEEPSEFVLIPSAVRMATFASTGGSSKVVRVLLS